MSKSDVLPYEKEAQELCTELLRIYKHDEHAVLAVLSCVSDYEEDVKELLQFIREDDEVTQETVAVVASEISDRRGEDE